DEAAGVLREADERAAEIERAAYEKGYHEGLTAGRDALDQQAAEEMRQIAALVDEAQRLHDTLLQQAEPEMVALALEVARKIVQAEVQTNPNVVTQVIAQAVERISGGPRVTIKVNPAELDRVREHWAQAYGANFREKEWAIEGDGSIAAGGCLLVTRYGSLDARIDAQFGELQRAFGLLLGVEG
ncbi:MAG: FliH/SctL family protein, partial [Chloroflexota bacterium]